MRKGVSLRCILFLLFVAFMQSGSAQLPFSETFSRCKSSNYLYENDSVHALYSTEKELALNIFDGFNPKYRDEITGTLKIQFLVKKDGSCCLISVENFTNVKTSRLKVKESISNLNGWRLMSPGSEKKDICVIVKFLIGTDWVAFYRMKLITGPGTVTTFRPLGDVLKIAK